MSSLITQQNQKQKTQCLSLWGYFFIVSGVVLLDHATKFWSEKDFLIHSSPTEIHSYWSQSDLLFAIGVPPSHWLQLSTTYIRNTGAAWGFLGNLPENIRPYFFYIFTFIAMIFILWFFFKADSQNKLLRMGIALVFAGALGNFIDRIWLHYVIDWIHFQWSIFSWKYDYPVFNVADCSVTGGVLLLLIEALVPKINAWKKKD